MWLRAYLIADDTAAMTTPAAVATKMTSDEWSDGWIVMAGSEERGKLKL